MLLAGMDVIGIFYGLLAVLLYRQHCSESDTCPGTTLAAPLFGIVYVIASIQTMMDLDRMTEWTEVPPPPQRNADRGAPADRRAAADPGRARLAARLRHQDIPDFVGCNKYMDALATLLVPLFPSFGLAQAQGWYQRCDSIVHRMHVLYAIRLCVVTVLFCESITAAVAKKSDDLLQRNLLVLYVSLWFARAGSLGIWTEVLAQFRRNRWRLRDH